jgi:Zn-dependent protease
MSRHGIPIGRIFGISIDLDYSWFLIVGLLTWLLAVSYYPKEFGGWSAGEYWVIGFVTAVMLFVSVLIHELAHSVAAQRYGLEVPRITLFLFGGVSQIATEPDGPMQEFWIAIVGPITSLLLAAAFWELEPVVASWAQVEALFEYLALLNLILAVFNLIPGFPLDGGRVLRAIMWRLTHSFHRATVTAGVTGRFFGFLLIFYGVWQALTADVVGGIWIAFIGWFLESAAGSQLQQEALKNLLGGHRVADAMRREFPQAASEWPLQEVVDRSILPSGTRYAIVTDGGRPVGMLTLTSIRAVPHHEWPMTTAAQAMIPMQKLTTTQPDAVLWGAFEKMGRNGVNQLPVIDGSGIVGMLSREDIVHYLGALRSLAA